MVATDSELISQARGLTNYDESIIDQSTMDELLSLSKDEIETELGESVDYYDGEHENAQRALFWFLVIALKIRAGEILGMNIQVSEIQTSQPPSGYETFFRNFSKKMSAASAELEGVSAVSQTTISRDNRSYGDFS